MIRAVNKQMAKFMRRRPILLLVLAGSFFTLFYIIATRESIQFEGSEILERLSTPQFAMPLDTKTKERRAAVVRTFQHAWGGYKAFAWGEDELLPLSKKGTKRFLLGGLIADVLDTMHLMGLKEEIAQALHPHLPPPPHPASLTHAVCLQARQWLTTLEVEKAVDVSLFETTIRILGGFLSAYHLTHDPLYKEKASALAERLLPAFESKPFPYPTVNLQTGRGRADRLSLSEPTSLQLEFRAAAHLLGRPALREGVDRVMDAVRVMSKMDGLMPLTGLDGGLNGRIGEGIAPGVTPSWGDGYEGG